MKRGAMNIIMGGQAGSEAKGKMAAYLAYKFGIRHFAGCLSPNAGHTVIRDGKKIVTHHIPVGIAGCRNPREAWVFIGPASVINKIGLMEELIQLRRSVGIDYTQIFIDERASLITDEHINKEKALTVIGSTAQGVGEARSDKVMRKGEKADSWKRESASVLGSMVTKHTNKLLMKIMDEGFTVLYEMGQGFDLCYDHGIDPVYCTSRNCTPMQGLADMGIPPQYLGDTYAVLRPYPIRVNNRDGSSGPYPSPEIDWDTVKKRCGADVDITEITTTTKLKRRVFEFSEGQTLHMVKTCDPTYLCLQFANYIDWACLDVSSIHDMPRSVQKWIGKLEVLTGKKVAYAGTGPGHEAMVDFGYDVKDI